MIYQVQLIKRRTLNWNTIHKIDRRRWVFGNFVNEVAPPTSIYLINCKIQNFRFQQNIDRDFVMSQQKCLWASAAFASTTMINEKRFRCTPATEEYCGCYQLSFSARTPSELIGKANIVKCFVYSFMYKYIYMEIYTIPSTLFWCVGGLFSYIFM